MKEYEKKMTEQSVVKKVKCNFCGKEEEVKEDFMTSLSNIEIVCGYGSTNDGTMFFGDVCDACIKKLFEKKLEKKEYISV